MRLTIIAALAFGFSLVAVPDRAQAFDGCWVSNLGWGLRQNVCWIDRNGDFEVYRGIPYYWYENIAFML